MYHQVQEILRKEGIPVIGLKGIVLASGIYEDEGVRPMGDVDILVPEGMGFKALELLLKAGARQNYVFRSVLHEKVHSHVRAISYNGVLVEIHQRLFSLGNPYHTKGVDFFKNTLRIEKQGVLINSLNHVWLGYHLLAHAAFNIRTGGLRFGWLVDMAILFRQQPDVDSYIKSVLQINPSRKKNLSNIVDMVKVLMYSDIVPDPVIADIHEAMKLRNVQKIHKVVNFDEIWHTPQLSRKIHLAFRELFPDTRYMKQWGRNKECSILKLYLKRLFGGIF